MAVGFIQSYALGKRFAENANYNIDADQELIALGLVKIGGRFELIRLIKLAVSSKQSIPLDRSQGLR